MYRQTKKATIEDIIEAGEAKTNDGKFVVDLERVPKDASDINYLNIFMKDVEGKLMTIKQVPFENVIASSSASRPFEKDGKPVEASSTTVTLHEISESDLTGGDYVPETKSTPEEQEKENKRVATMIKTYVEQTNKTCRALAFLSSYYRATCEDLIEQDKKESFRKKYGFIFNKATRKDGDGKIPDIRDFAIEGYTDKKTGEFVKFPTSHFKLKLNILQSGKIGIKGKDGKGEIPIVFDVRRSMGGNSVPAKVKTEMGEEDLNRNNVDSFITFRSVLSGTSNFGSIIDSKMGGLSFSCKISSLYVLRHTPYERVPKREKNILMRMTGGIDYSKRDVAPVEEIKVAPKKEDENPFKSRSDSEESDTEKKVEPKKEEEPKKEKKEKKEGHRHHRIVKKSDD